MLEQVLPLETQTPWSQQSFAEPQLLFSQQIWPGPPQARQFPELGSQESPGAVQKSAAFPPPPQHCWLSAPQALLVPAPQLLAVVPAVPPQRPSPGPQLRLEATQLTEVQQPFPAQVVAAQQGSPATPQATKAPAEQTWVERLPAAPEGTHWLLDASKQPPAAHEFPAQAI